MLYIRNTSLKTIHEEIENKIMIPGPWEHK